MPSGFMSEHSAEYVLVPDLACQLQAQFGRVVPFFFWARREGGRIAKESYSGSVRLLAAYARRPKVDYPSDPVITVKFNDLLFERAWQLNRIGIPVLAGVPCVSSLAELRLGVQCAWFHIEPSHQQWEDSLARIPLATPSQTELARPDTPIRGPLHRDDVVQLAATRTHPMLWREALEHIRQVNRGDADGLFIRRWFGPFAPYKPFYLALLD